MALMVFLWQLACTNICGTNYLCHPAHATCTHGHTVGQNPTEVCPTPLARPTIPMGMVLSPGHQVRVHPQENPLRMCLLLKTGQNLLQTNPHCPPPHPTTTATVFLSWVDLALELKRVAWSRMDERPP